MADTQRPAPPIKEEIASSADGRDITKPFIGPLEYNQDTVLAGRGGGLEVYEEVLRDDQVYSTFQQRRALVCAREWQVEPGGTDAQSVALADFVREMLFSPSLEFDAASDKMLYARFYGYGTAECMWAQDGRNIYLEKVKVRRARRFRYDMNGGLRLLLRSNMITGELMPERKFWTWSVGADNDDAPYGLGLGHYCYWPVFFKRNGLKFWLIALEKFGMPTVMGSFPPNTSPEDQNKLLAAARAIGTDSAVIKPAGMLLELLSSAANGTADYGTLHDKMDEAISKVNLSQTMTTDNGGSLSQARVHQIVANYIAKSDSDMECASFMRGPMQWLRDWNYPDANVPKVFRSFDDPVDLTQQAARDKSIYDMGFEPSEEYVQSTYGDGWTKRQMPPPSPFGAPDQAAFAEGAVKSDTPDPIAAAALRRARQWKMVMGRPREQLQEAFDRSRTFDALKKSLAGLRGKLDMRALHARLESDTLQAIGAGAIGNASGTKAFADIEVISDISPQDALTALRRRLAKPYPAFSWLDVQREMHAQMFTVAKTAGYDVLDDIGKSVDDAIANGETFEDFQKNLTQILIDHGWWGKGPALDQTTGNIVDDVQLGSPERLRTIYDTNFRTSYSAGHWLSIERNKADQPLLMYVHNPSLHPRPQHELWDGTTLPIDDPWWDMHYPPCGWYCHCTTIALSQHQGDTLARAGRIKTDAPPSLMRRLMNADGQTVEVPDGIDPDFAYNPGKALIKALTG